MFYLTNRFHVAVRLFSNRSQMTSTCGKNNKVTHFDVPCDQLGALRKIRRQRERERHQTIVLKSRTTAVHVRYNSWYIFLPFSAKQQREMTKVENVKHEVF